MSGEVVMARGLTRVYQEEAVPVHALRGVDFSLSCRNLLACPVLRAQVSRPC